MPGCITTLCSIVPSFEYAWHALLGLQGSEAAEDLIHDTRS
jgi:hypothetical protein